MQEPLVEFPRDDITHETSSASRFSDTLSEPSQENEEQASSQSSAHRIKRKPRRHDNLGNQKNKRTKLQHASGYRNLLNTLITEARRSASPETVEPLQRSQINASTWTAEEKSVLFSSLGRIGKDDLQRIAHTIGTKSESEIQDYLKLLKQSVTERGQFALPGKTVTFSDITAAFEIQPSCVEALDEAADVLELEQRKYNEYIERDRHGRLWLLNRESAHSLKESMANSGSSEAAGNTDLYSAASLLHLPNLLNLATHLFMNSAEPEANWQQYAEPDEEPSLFATAFIDFRNLLIGVTKRIVSTALFLAMSRMRAESFRQYHISRPVTKHDVIAALDVLHLPINKQSFWINVARRCSLHVFEADSRYKLVGDRLTYDDVEQRLRLGIPKDESSAPASPNTLKTMSIKRTGNTRLPETNDLINADSSQLPDLYTSSDDEAQEIYLENFDQIASAQEERQLWAVLGQHSNSIKRSNLEHLQNIPQLKKNIHFKPDGIDWRDGLNYRSIWESYETPVPSSDFVINRSYQLAIPMTADSTIEQEGDSKDQAIHLVPTPHLRTRNQSEEGDIDDEMNDASSDYEPLFVSYPTSEDSDDSVEEERDSRARNSSPED